MNIYIRLNFTLFSILYKSRIHILWNIPIYERGTSPADSPGPWVSSPDPARSGPRTPSPVRPRMPDGRASRRNPIRCPAIFHHTARLLP